MSEDQMGSLVEDVVATIRDVPDFPKPGILFKDIAPVLGDAALLNRVIDWMAQPHLAGGVDYVLGMESRGFIFGTPLALRLGVGFVPARKPGKLPWRTQSVSYALEYGEATLEVHEDAFPPGARVLIVDDLLATGGTAKAAADLVRMIGGEVVGFSFMIELGFLDGAAKLEAPVRSLVTY
jgi:adenine phosphoribosyltransferase